jgi:hypothetical protein
MEMGCGFQDLDIRTDGDLGFKTSTDGQTDRRDLGFRTSTNRQRHILTELIYMIPCGSPWGYTQMSFLVGFPSEEF